MEDTTGSAVVLDSGSPSSISTVRSLGRHGVDVVVASELARPPCASSRYCTEFVPLPPLADRTDYTAALLDLARRPSVLTFVLAREQDAFLFGKHRDQFADHLRTVWPDSDRIRTTQDRVALFEAADRAGVPYPRSALLTAVDDWTTEYVVKSRYALLTAEYDAAIDGTHLRKPPSTVYLEPGTEPDREALVQRMGHVPLVQSYVRGGEYSFRALYDEGDPVLTSQIRQHRAYHYMGGASVYRESMYDPQLEELGRALLDELDWHGLAEVEFLRTDDGYLLMEANPRLWASVSTDVVAGADYPTALLRLASGDPIEPSTYETGVGTHILRGELSYLYSIVSKSCPLVEPPGLGRAVADAVWSLWRHPNCDYLSLSDPSPFFRDLANAIAELATGPSHTGPRRR
ncbi:ATP-grasp domain-containing protein [Haloarcula marina]|uniref:carboxylate--amine ligase n=1 Tax=Haloarcula marina TaxID=2961574 RepID=UPI0020B77D8F|nr:ATP-grasp domain-containing protein [Halomicroarcula marina]